MTVMVQDIVITGGPDAATPGLTGVLGIPDGDGPWPAVVVVHEAFGVLQEMRDQVAHLASLGYLALMPDLYTAGGFLRCIGATVKALQSGKGRAWADIEASRRWLLERDDFTGAVGIIGFCMGGGFALLAAANGYDSEETTFQAAAVNYGLLPDDLDAIEHSCPVVASYGDKDKTIKHGATRLEALYTKLGVDHDVKEYPGAGHAFMNERMTGPKIFHPVARISGISPNPEATVDAWHRIDAFFQKHLVPRG